MPLLTITTPEVETRIRVVDSEENLLFEDDVIYIDHLLSIAQQDVDMEHEEAVLKWLPVFTDRVKDHYSADLTETSAFYIAREAARLMWDIKKKYDSTLTSPESTESIHST